MDHSKVAYTRTEAEAKFQPDSHLFEPARDDAWGKTPLRAIQHITEQITKTHASEEVALELLNADDKVMTRLQALLQSGGVNIHALKVDTYGAHSYVKIPNASQDDMINIASALASTVDAPDRTTHYPLLPRDALNEIADIASANMKISSLVTLRTIEMDPARAAAYGVDSVPERYVDVDMRAYSASPVSVIREDSQYAQINGQAGFAPKSSLAVDPDKIPQLKAAFKKAGISCEVQGAVMNAEASSKDVVRALDQSGMIPSHFLNAFDQ